MAGAPLRGLRIVAVEQFGAGPFGTLQLADLGAEIIRLEDPSTGGDVGRYVSPGRHGTDSLYFDSFNRGKRSVLLDLKAPAGQEVLHRLVRGAHAVYANLRGDVIRALGLTYETLGVINPAIVCVFLTAYGRDNDRSTEPGYDPLIQAEAGWAALTGDPGGPPVKSGLSLADYTGGLTAALALLAAVLDARQTGRGRDVDVNLYDVALAMHNYRATWYLTAGISGERTADASHPSIVPFQFFATADGHIAVACAKEKFFIALVELMDLPSVAADSRFSSFEARRENRVALIAILSERFGRQPTAYWIRTLRGRVPVAPVRSMEAALDTRELTSRAMLAAYRHPTMGDVKTVGVPIKMDGFIPLYQPGPPLDGDREAVLAAAGYRAEEIDDLRHRGAFGHG
ncbi:MAG TPA: CoA transferase [Candidatus Dormibacteraeota bacterium]|jgi:crotonobetainyl-CoA:carnitine CoA-transferase CaiB-like acyl-CoA transferase|nr:CoA transferase [Candidatus Dormibacteraeota bacterium]